VNSLPPRWLQQRRRPLMDLPYSSCHWTRISSGYSDGSTGSACQKSWLEFFHLSMPSPYDLQCVLDQPVYSMLWLGLTHSSCVVHVTVTCVSRTLSVISCDLRFSHILMTVMSMQLVHILHVHTLRLPSLVPRPFPPPVFDRLQYANTYPLQAPPPMSCIHLVIINASTGN